MAEPFPGSLGPDVYAKIFPLPARCMPLPAVSDSGPTPVQVLQPHQIAQDHPETLWDVIQLSDEIFLYEDGDSPLPEHVTPGW